MQMWDTNSFHDNKNRKIMNLKPKLNFKRYLAIKTKFVIKIIN